MCVCEKRQEEEEKQESQERSKRQESELCLVATFKGAYVT